jgi:hypothetical protein
LRFGNQFDNSTLDVLKKCKNLQYCNFSNWGQLSSVADFAKHLKLKYLAINDCKEIKEDTVQKLLTECASLRYVELLGLSIDYHKVLSNSFKQPCPHRSSILNLVAPRANPISYLNTCKWVNVIPSEPYGMSPFGRFTSIRDHYPHKKQ